MRAAFRPTARSSDEVITHDFEVTALVLASLRWNNEHQAVLMGKMFRVILAIIFLGAGTGLLLGVLITVGLPAISVVVRTILATGLVGFGAAIFPTIHRRE
jgi:hypothetical protein